jgi:hypothetical protein
MKPIFMCIFIFLSACSDSTKVEQMCDKLRGDYENMQKQLPIHSDITTQIVGISGLYLPSKDECFSTFTINLDVNAFIHAISQNNFDKQKKLSAFFKTEAGKFQLNKMVKNKFNKKIETNGFPTKMKGFTFTEIIKVSGVDMETITLEHKY